MIITSSEAVSYLSFVSDRLTRKEPAFVAFHYYGAGHYDSTKTSEGCYDCYLKEIWCFYAYRIDEVQWTDDIADKRP